MGVYCVTSQEKRKRIIAAVTVTGVLLIVILVIVIIWQIVIMCASNARKDRLEQEYEYISSQAGEMEDWLEKFELNSDSVMYLLAIQNGWRPAR